MTWNDTVLAHPHLSPTDKLVFHLLERLGGDTPAVRRQLTIMLGLSDRQLRRISAKLQHCTPGDNSSAPEGSVDNLRTCTSAAVMNVRDRTPASAPPTRMRTSLSSSSEEEEKTSTPLFLSPTPGGAGGAEPTPEFLGQMKNLWHQIDPGCRDFPEAWFGSLCREFGAARTHSVFQRFTLAEKTLSHLTRPASYQSYFSRWCRREQQEDEALLSQARASPWLCSWTSADHHQPLSGAYRAARNHRSPQHN